MKNVIKIIGACALTVFLVSCNNQAEQEENQTEVEQVNTDDMNFQKAKAELKEKYKIAIANIDKEIDVLKAKTESATEKGKADLNESMEVLKKERDELSKKIDEMQDATIETWEDWNESAEELLEKAELRADSIKQNIEEVIKS